MRPPSSAWQPDHNSIRNALKRWRLLTPAVALQGQSSPSIDRKDRSTKAGVDLVLLVSGRRPWGKAPTPCYGGNPGISLDDQPDGEPGGSRAVKCKPAKESGFGKDSGAGPVPASGMSGARKC
jgi:hypothetical protein